MKVTKNCKHCGKEFKVLPSVIKKGGGIFCSRKCCDISRRTRLLKKCKFCGKEFEVQLKTVKQGYGKYCSRECYLKTLPQKITKICEQCGKEFQYNPSRLKNSNVRFCSTLCYFNSKGGKIKKNCEYCGKEFETYSSLIEKNRGKFCSKQCHYKSKRVKKICEYCGKEFEVHKHRVRASPVKYCSQECYRKATNKYDKIKTNCQICGKEFYTYNCHLEKGYGKFCSQECFGQSRTKRYDGEIPENILEKNVNDKNSLVSLENIAQTYSKQIYRNLETYPEIMSLSKQGYSGTEIAKKTDISSSMIYNYLSGDSYPKFYQELKNCFWLPLKPSKELAYLSGFLFGDGHLKKDLSISRFFNEDKYLLKIINEYLEIVFGQKQKITTEKIKRYGNAEITTIRTDSFIARAFYVCGVPKGNKTKQKVSIPKWIQNNQLYLRYFLGAIFDAEGHIKARKFRSYAGEIFRIKMNNVGFLKDLMHGFDLLGIKTSDLLFEKGKNMYYFNLGRKLDNVIKFYQLIPINETEKRRKFKLIIDSNEEFLSDKNFCPKCHMRYIQKRKTKTPIWRCNRCKIEFDEPMTYSQIKKCWGLDIS